MNIRIKHSLNNSLEKRRKLIGTLFISPWIIGLFTFTLYPMLYSIWLSLCSVDFSTSGIKTNFVGLKWYYDAFKNDPRFVGHLLDTLKFIGFLTPMILVVSLLLALLLNKTLPGLTVFRAIFFFPVVFINGPVLDKLIGNSATAIIQPNQYVVYQIIGTFPDVISVPLLYIFDHVILILWFSGIQMLIMLSSLKKVNTSLYEAASIDGGSKWQVFWKITLPAVKPMLLVCAVYTIVDLSCYSNNRIIVYVKENMNVLTKPYSFSSAMSWVFAVGVLLLLMIAFLLLRERRDHIEKE